MTHFRIGQAVWVLAKRSFKFPKAAIVSGFPPDRDGVFVKLENLETWVVAEDPNVPDVFPSKLEAFKGLEQRIKTLIEEKSAEESRLELQCEYLCDVRDKFRVQYGQYERDIDNLQLGDIVFVCHKWNPTHHHKRVDDWISTIGVHRVVDIKGAQVYSMDAFGTESGVRTWLKGEIGVKAFGEFSALFDQAIEGTIQAEVNAAAKCHHWSDVLESVQWRIAELEEEED